MKDNCVVRNSLEFKIIVVTVKSVTKIDSALYH